MAMMGRNGIVVVFIACAIGAAAGWFAAGAWGGEADTAEFAETLRAVGDVVSGDPMN